MKFLPVLIVLAVLTGCVESRDAQVERNGFPEPTTITVGGSEWSVTSKPGEVRVYRRCAICQPDNMTYHDQAREAVRRVLGCEIAEFTALSGGVEYFGRLQCAPGAAPAGASGSAKNPCAPMQESGDKKADR